MNRYNVDVFVTVRLCVHGIPADSPEAAARITNEMGFQDCISLTGQTASEHGKDSAQFRVSGGDVQDVDCLYYAAFPVLNGNTLDSDYNNGAMIAEDFSEIPAGKDPHDHTKNVLRELLQAIVLDNNKDYGFYQESLVALNRAARLVGHPVFELHSKGDGYEIDEYPLANCPPGMSYADWVNDQIHADFTP